MTRYRVYDERTDQTLLEGTKSQCASFMHEYYPMDSDEFQYIWMEEVVDLGKYHFSKRRSTGHARIHKMIMLNTFSIIILIIAFIIHVLLG